MENTQLLFFVAIGGALGSLCRYVLGQMPYFGASFWVNILGSIVLGIFVYILKLDTMGRLSVFLVSGFCGGFTTFSGFSLENLHLIQAGHGGLALLNIMVNVVLSIASLWLVFYLSKNI